jgi:hypothetical protein
MLNTFFTIPAAELPLLQKSLPACPTIELVGTSFFSLSAQAYVDVYLTHETAADLYQLGICVGRELEQLEAEGSPVA